MKILVLASRFPYPLERGDKLRLFHQIKELSKSNEIYLFALSHSDVDARNLSVLNKYCQSIKIYHPSLTSRSINILKTLFGSLPFQVGINWDSKGQSVLNKFMKECQPDITYCQLIRMAPYAINLNIPRVLDYMDAYGVGMLRRSELSRWPMNIMYYMEGKRTIRYEKDVIRSFDAHTIISKQDANEIAKDVMTVVPNGIDTSYFSPLDIEKSFDIGFVGKMGYLPNVDAAETLVREIAPAYERHYNKRLKILIAGARPHPRVLRLKENHVEVSGWVDDIRQAYASCRMIVAPLTGGTGQQNKILESMSMGIPCITTTTVNRAINGLDNRHLLIADLMDEYLENIRILLTDKEKYNQLSQEGRQFAKETYGWNESIQQLNQIFVSLKDKHKEK